MDNSNGFSGRKLGYCQPRKGDCRIKNSRGGNVELFGENHGIFSWIFRPASHGSQIRRGENCRRRHENSLGTTDDLEGQGHRERCCTLEIIQIVERTLLFDKGQGRPMGCTVGKICVVSHCICCPPGGLAATTGPMRQRAMRQVHCKRRIVACVGS